MTRRDVLTPAVLRIWLPEMRRRGFVLVGRRDFARLSMGLLHLFNFQLASFGGGDFCLNVTAFLVAGNRDAVLEPGFRVANQNGSNLWLPTETSAEAEVSVGTMLAAALDQSEQFFARNASPQGHATFLREQRIGASHHGLFQIGVAEALSNNRTLALAELTAAVAKYAEDGRSFCFPKIDLARELMQSLRMDTHQSLLRRWFSENAPLHRLRDTSTFGSAD